MGAAQPHSRHSFILPCKIHDFAAAAGGTANNTIVCCNGQYNLGAGDIQAVQDSPLLFDTLTIGGRVCLISLPIK